MTLTHPLTLALSPETGGEGNSFCYALLGPTNSWRPFINLQS